MPPKINRRKHARRFNSVHLPMRHMSSWPSARIGLWSDPHPIAKILRVRECRQQRRPRLLAMFAEGKPVEVVFPRSTFAGTVFAGAMFARAVTSLTRIAYAGSLTSAGSSASTYPPCPRSQRGIWFARRAVAASNPHPATQQNSAQHRRGIRPNHTEIHRPAEPSPLKSAPRFQRVSHRPQIQRPRKIVSTARRHNQHGKLQPHQRRQVPVAPFHRLQKLQPRPPPPPKTAVPRPTLSRRPTQRPQIALRSSQSQNGRGAHAFSITTHALPKSLLAAGTSIYHFHFLSAADTLRRCCRCPTRWCR